MKTSGSEEVKGLAQVDLFSLRHARADSRILISSLVILFPLAVMVKFQNADEFPFLLEFFYN